MTFTNEVLRIVVHVPVYDQRLGDFTLFKYQNMPILENGAFYQVRVDHPEYLAVSRSRELHFFARSDVSCSAIGDKGNKYRVNIKSLGFTHEELGLRRTML